MVAAVGLPSIAALAGEAKSYAERLRAAYTRRSAVEADVAAWMRFWLMDETAQGTESVRGSFF